MGEEHTLWQNLGTLSERGTRSGQSSPSTKDSRAHKVGGNVPDHGGSKTLAWPPLQSVAVKNNFILCKFWSVSEF